jgi:hypothetical protein
MRWDVAFNGESRLMTRVYMGDTISAMKKWVTSSLKRSGQHGSSVVVTRTVEDKITPSHFIKHTFTVAVVGERGGVNVHYEKK